MKKSKNAQGFSATFTEAQLDLIVPNLSKPISEDKYLGMLTADNHGVAYGSVMSYGTEEERKLNELIAPRMEKAPS